MRHSRSVASALVLLVLTLAARPAAATWPHEPFNGNVAVSTAAANQTGPTSVSDGAGGVIVTWNDSRAGTNYDVYAQRISAAGVPQWAADGVALTTAAGDQVYPTILPDGAGGAIVTWEERGGADYDIYAQRIDADGTTQWTTDGVVVCNATGRQEGPTLASDGAGGAIITWYDTRSAGANANIHAQRIDAGGTAQWTADGVVLCAAADFQFAPAIIPDGTGGAIVTWNDYRSGTNYDSYAQRISAAGVTLWTANGVALSTAAGDQYQSAPPIVSDGAGGAIVTWFDSRNGGANVDIYAQRINAAGATQWTPNGVALCAAAGNQYEATIVSDGVGGAIVAWGDIRSVTNYDIYTQRISAAGAAQWTPNGVALCTAAGNEISPRLMTDGAGGALVTWQDARSITNYDVYVQRISAAGLPQWTPNGAALCTSPGDQSGIGMVPDGAGGALVTWQDARSITNYDVYVQRIERFGKLGNPEPAIASVLDIPNDQGGRVRLAWDASYLDQASDPDLVAYDIFRSVPPNLAQEAVEHGAGRALSAGEVPVEGERAYLFTGPGTQQLAWEHVITVTAQHFITTYGSTQATTSDSIAASNPTTSFLVVGRNGAGSKYWLSVPAEGYSVDNLPPVTPAPFTGQYAAGTTYLHWNANTETDLAGYRLYRGSSVAFVPGPANLVAAPPDTGYADVAGVPYVYKLTAVDAHGNESPVAILVLDGVVGVADAGPLSLSLAAPRPNPARDATSLRFTLSRAGVVRLSVFDAAGRRVAMLRDGLLPAGEHAERFTLHDRAGRALASGIYVVRLEAEGRVITKRFATIR